MKCPLCGKEFDPYDLPKGYSSSVSSSTSHSTTESHSVDNFESDADNDVTHQRVTCAGKVIESDLGEETMYPDDNYQGGVK
jgi:hypothetical protein